ncbi:IS200/IS605 family transposase [soil metagenome]
MIDAEWEPRLYEYLGGTIRGMKAHLIEINGMPDHVHLLVRESKSVADQEFIGRLKGDSSRWVNQTFAGRPHFCWQGGYGWFSVGPADLEAARRYIRDQKEHHKTTTFREEFRRFLKKYGVEYDERYVWE